MRASLIACAAVLAGSAFSAQASTLHLLFDGYCDGVDVSFDAAGVGHGTETGCDSGPVVGTKGSVKGQTKGYTLNVSHVPNAVYVVRNDHTWSIYLSDGSTLDEGTWTAANGVRQDASLPHTGRR
jgi:hypothetical protein